MSSRQLVNIILFCLGIVMTVLLATAIDYLDQCKVAMNANLHLLQSAHFSVLRTDSVVTEQLIINPVIEIPCE